MGGPQTPRVSVVMPCFNHAPFVADAIRSVLGQTLVDLELIVIDDASTDTTPDVIRGFSDPRMAVEIAARNRGAHATINAGLARARGTYLTVINSDDVFMPTRLARLVETIEATRADVLGTDVALIGRDGVEITRPEHYWLTWFGGLKAHLAEHADLRRTLLRGNVFLTTSNLFFTREAFRRVGPFEDARYTHDYAFALRAVALGLDVRMSLDQKTLAYRLHGGNTILESPVAATRETFDLLVRLMPMLAGEANAVYFEELGAHIKRLERDIETVHTRPPAQRLFARLRQTRKRWLGR